MKLSKLLVAGSLAAVVIGTVFAAPAHAEAAFRHASSGDPSGNTGQNEGEAIAEMDTLSRYAAPIDAATRDGVFDFAQAVAAGTPAAIAQQWAEGYSLGGGRVIGTAVTHSPVPQLRASCRGSNAIWTDWLGGHARFSSCVVPTLTGALQAGVGATGLAAAISGAAGLTVGAVVAIVPALIQYSTWSIQACAANGTGVELVFAGFICWAQ